LFNVTCVLYNILIIIKAAVYCNVRTRTKEDVTSYLLGMTLSGENYYGSHTSKKNNL